MTIRLSALLIVAAAALGSIAPAQADTGWVDGRQAVQRARIRDGAHRGDLTRREVKRLRGQQRRIARLEDRLGADGHLSRRDRRKLDRALDRSSTRIARARHNDRARGHGGRRGQPWRRHGGNGAHGAVNNTEVNNYYGTEQTETVESSPSFNRSVEFDFDGVRVIWSSSGMF